MKRGEYSVSFLVQPNAITRENIPLLLILTRSNCSVRFRQHHLTIVCGALLG